MAYTTINDPEKYFNTLLWTGTNNTDTKVGVGFAPDMVLLRLRSEDENWFLADSTRGANKHLRVDSSDEENDDALLTAFTSDGYTLHGGQTGANAKQVNGGLTSSLPTHGRTYIGFNWKANGGTTVSNTSGTITTTVQANTTAGFSIVSYAGQASAGTIGHGLGAEPHLVIIKNKDASQSWHVYWKALGNQGLNWIEVDNAASSNSTTWNTTTPTSSVISLNGGGSYNGTNNSGSNYIAYCFAPIQGYSKMGYYKGNYNANGPFVYTGFKPAWILIKTADSGNDWAVYNNKASPYNPVNDHTKLNTEEAESADYDMDFLSNGFKIRHAIHLTNSNTGSARMLYYAIAESPFVTSNGTPNNGTGATYTINQYSLDG